MHNAPKGATNKNEYSFYSLLKMKRLELPKLK